MFDVAGNRPRLIVVGAEVDRGFEPILSRLAGSFELCLVGDSYSTWSAEYADTHRACSYRNYDSLFNAVTDLMGEVPFCGAVSFDIQADPELARVAAKLGLPLTTAPGDGDARLEDGDHLVVDFTTGSGLGACFQVSAGGSACVEVAEAGLDLVSVGAGLAVFGASTLELQMRGLSPILRSGLLDALSSADVGRFAAAAFDPATRELMRWLEPIA